MQHITSQRRLVVLVGLAVVLGLAAAVVSQILIALINGVTHLAYYGTLDTSPVSPAHHHLGTWAMLLPVAGGLIVGAMARYGSPAIRGHGIPEAMEQVLLNESRIPPRMIWLKPVSAAVAIGTGGPFGAEATGARYGMLGSAPAFDVPTFAPVTATALAVYTAMGLVMGLLAVGVLCGSEAERTVAAVKRAFDVLLIRGESNCLHRDLAATFYLWDPNRIARV